jgi:hypothetical protein
MRMLDKLIMCKFQIKISLSLGFASKINISNLDSGTLVLCFQDLRQVTEQKIIHFQYSFELFSSYLI